MSVNPVIHTLMGMALLGSQAATDYKKTAPNSASTLPGPNHSEGDFAMPRKAHNPSRTGNQDSVAAKQAFAAYAELTRKHAMEPDLWEAPERIEARRSAHARFVSCFEVRA